MLGHQMDRERQEGGWQVTRGLKEVGEAGISHGLRVHLGSHLIVDV